MLPAKVKIVCKDNWDENFRGAIMNEEMKENFKEYVTNTHLDRLLTDTISELAAKFKVPLKQLYDLFDLAGFSF